MTRRTYRSSGRGGLISLRCNIALLASVREKLGKDNMDALRSSCFGHLFHISQIQFQGQLFNILLRKLDKSSLSRNCLTFNIRGCRVDFTPADFATVTGLKFNEWVDPPLESEIHRIVFRQKSSITIDDVVQAFNRECRETGGTSLLSLRLAFLVILYGIILVVGAKSYNIDMTYLHLIDDLDMFKSFPWGHVAYSLLVRRTHQARDILENIERKQKRVAFDANGFVFALQVWVYEVMPIFSRNCAQRIEGAEERLPKLLRWAASKPIKFDTVNKYFLSAPVEILICSTTFSQSEKDFLMKLGFDDILDRPIGCRNDVLPHATCDHPKKKQRVSPPMNSYCIPDITVSVHADNPTDVQLLERRVAELERLINELKESKLEGNSEKGDANELTAPPPPLKRRMCSSTQYCTLNPDSDVPSDKTPPAKIDERCKVESVSVRRRPSTRTSLRTTFSSAVIPTTVIPNKYDPNEARYSAAHVGAFETWRTGARNGASIGHLKLPFAMVRDVDVVWFDHIWRSRGWLSTDHINAIINLLLIISRKEPCRFEDGWTALEMICWGALTNENYEVVRDGMGQYVEGVYPRDGPLHWGLAKNVYGIGHINGNHWVCYEVSLDNQRVTVYDSLSRSKSFDKVSTLFGIVARNVARLCDDYGVWEMKGVSASSRREWHVVSPSEPPPQQSNGSDCGIMAVKYMECLVSGTDIQELIPERCGVFRQSYCGRIHSLAEPDID